MSFEEYLAASPLERYLRRAEEASPADVERALGALQPGFEEYLALLSPAGAAALEGLAERARQVTRERFGRVIQLYAPMYVSNECTNGCLYCGFNRKNEIRRITLSPEEVEQEAAILWQQGFRDLLLVSGEAPGRVSMDYFREVARRLSPRFPALSAEIYPLSDEEYGALADSGIDGLTLFQETYDRELYGRVHPSGRKADYSWRLEAPGRAAGSGMRRIGIGALLGLGPWRREAICLGLHALWLQKEHWRSRVSIAFPRLRRAPGGFAPPSPVSDAELVQLMCALRLLLPDAGLTLSTRESAKLRDGLARICVTQMSAGSRTEPGGYGHPGDAGEQFSVEDGRSAAQVASTLLSLGFEPVWKDWDGAFRSAASEAA